ncbi:MAG: tetratricopeptide repeat protein [Cyanobacteria bacterium TGS_CYA1]|nr:tetratricopeptide repeat protein [Cyanobacteria bacterium TGS_CYA1]
MALAISLSMPRFVLAEESSCHDYPGHREVLNEGQSQVHGGSHRSAAMIRGFAEFGRREVYPDKVEDRIEIILKRIKTNNFEWSREFTEKYAEDYFTHKKYGECQQLLESVLESLSPEEQEKYFDIIAICHLLKDQNRDPKSKSNYLEKLIALADKQSVLTDKTKDNLVKVCAYVNKADKAIKTSHEKIDPEITLRMGLLNLVLDRKDEAVEYNNKVVANFRRDIIFAPKQLRTQASELGLENLLLKEPGRYLSEEYKSAFEKGRELILSGAVTLSREAGTSEDLIAIAIRWIKSMASVPLAANKQALLISVLPEGFRTEFANKDCIIRCTDFAKVFDALKKRGWTSEAIAFKRGFFAEGFIDQSFGGVEQITRYYFEKGDTKSALSVYEEASEPIAKLNNKNTQELLIAYSRITPLYQDLAKYKVSDSEAEAASIKKLYVAVKNNYDVHKCLELADSLTKTGWKLVEQGDAKAAIKLYKSALDIREKNLPPDNRILGSTYLDAGRAAALCDDAQFAEQCFKKTLKIFSKNPIPDDDDYKIAVESYGSLLNKNKRYDEAQKVYAKLKEIR